MSLRRQGVQQVVGPADRLFQSTEVSQVLAQPSPFQLDLLFGLLGRAIAADLPADQLFELLCQAAFGMPEVVVDRGGLGFQGFGHLGDGQPLAQPAVEDPQVVAFALGVVLAGQSDWTARCTTSSTQAA